MSGPSEQEYLLRGGGPLRACPEAHRQARVHHAQPGYPAWVWLASVRWRSPALGAPLPWTVRLRLHSTSGSRDLHPGVQVVNARFPGIKLSDRAGRGFSASSALSLRPRTAKARGTSMSVRRHLWKCRRSSRADVIEPWDNYIPKDVIDGHHSNDPEGGHDKRQAL